MHSTPVIFIDFRELIGPSVQCKPLGSPQMGLCFKTAPPPMRTGWELIWISPLTIPYGLLAEPESSRGRAFQWQKWTQKNGHIFLKITRDSSVGCQHVGPTLPLVCFSGIYLFWMYWNDCYWSFPVGIAYRSSEWYPRLFLNKPNRALLSNRCILLHCRRSWWIHSIWDIYLIGLWKFILINSYCEQLSGLRSPRIKTYRGDWG